MKRITDPSFKYTPSMNTNIRETFARVREQQEAEAERERLGAQWRLKNVISAKKGTR